MVRNQLSETADRYLHKLCKEFETRAVGSRGNQDASDFFAQTAKSFGFRIERQEFDCMHWMHGEVHLQAGGYRFEVLASPYSLGCQIKAPLVAASTLEELEKLEAKGKILLLYREIAKEQLMPKSFPFYNPQEHQQFYTLLETKSPTAIVTATSKDSGVAAAQYPFPMIEDGEFDIPSVFMKDVDGDRLACFVGENVELNSDAWRIPSTGCNIVARKGGGSESRIVLVAHIDAKIGTPGALDNAGGTSTLLLMAELLKDYSGNLQVEIVSLNGEDYYAASGQKRYLDVNQDHLSNILLAVNLDGLGYIEGETAYSHYHCPEGIVLEIEKAFANRKGFVEGPQWYQGDHSIFIQKDIPAMAITLEKFEFVWEQIAHTEEDTPELVDEARLVEAAEALRDLILIINSSL